MLACLKVSEQSLWDTKIVREPRMEKGRERNIIEGQKLKKRGGKLKESNAGKCRTEAP